MAYKKPQRRTVRIRTPLGPCAFCKAGKDPDYKDYHDLQKFVSDRAKILSAKRTGICSKHQRRLTVAIKRARHLGLLPFTGSI